MVDFPKLRRDTGGALTFGVLENVPGVKEAYAGLLAKVAALPFVPATFQREVSMVMLDNPGAIWVPTYAINAPAWRAGKDVLLDDCPDWLKEPQIARAWNTLADWWQETMQPLLAGWAKDQSAIMAAAENNAAFWDVLYKSVKPVADLGNIILDAPTTVGGALASSLLNGLKAIAPVLIVVGVGVIVYLAAKKKIAP